MTIRTKDEDIIRMYVDEGLSTYKIAEVADCTPTCIRNRLRKNGILLRVSPKATLKPSASLSYALGVIVGDGCVIINTETFTYRVVLTVKSERFAKKFADSLKAIGLKPFRIISGNYHRVVAVNKEFAYWVKEAIHNLETATCGYTKEFVQGFWDSEGNYYLSKTNQMQVRMHNTNKELLMTVEKMIKHMNIECKINGPYISGGDINHKQIYHLSIVGGNDECTKFLGFIELDVKGVPIKEVC